ncbi:hypothetical protein XFF6990_230016 [Xanthomonas citri pv. fuscans]|nr:hypothetical protein XFF6990_230016 [Xanthomonas citri pv. fuscans]
MQMTLAGAGLCLSNERRGCIYCRARSLGSRLAGSGLPVEVHRKPLQRPHPDNTRCPAMCSADLRSRLPLIRSADRSLPVPTARHASLGAARFRSQAALHPLREQVYEDNCDDAADHRAEHGRHGPRDGDHTAGISHGRIGARGRGVFQGQPARRRGAGDAR